MNQPINNENLLSFAWNIIKPYIIEVPTLLNAEFGWLKKTTHVSNILTTPELLFEYMGFLSFEDANLGTDNFGNSPIAKTKAFAKIPADQKLASLIDVSNVFNCFLSIFSTREKQVKDNYRELLYDYYYDYKAIKFYHATNHDLVFESFIDFITYFDDLCVNFKFEVVFSKEMLEAFCTLMTSVVSRHYNLKQILTPSYSYNGLLPIYVAENVANKTLHLVMSITVNRCFIHIKQESFGEDETPKLFNFILEQILKSLRGSLVGYMSTESIFNNDILDNISVKPAKNVFTLTKSFTLGANKVQLYSYNKKLDQFMAIITMTNSLSRFVYFTEELIENNTPPFSMKMLPMFAITADAKVQHLNEKEMATLTSFINDLKFILQ